MAMTKTEKIESMYNTVAGCRDMYFRIAKIDPYNWLPTRVRFDDRTSMEYRKRHFNWYPVIYDFVEKRTAVIDTVTIIRDYEATNSDDFFTDSKKRPFDKMPIRVFLSGNGDIDLNNTIQRKIAE
jgi:hypothetical protein